MRPRVLVRGAGEHASGTAWRLFRCGFPVACTEIAHPRAVRRLVSFATAVAEGSTEVEGVAGRRWDPADSGRLGDGPPDHVPVFVDPDAVLVDAWRPDVIVDARMLKRPADTRRHQAPLVIGLGPGLRAGRDVDVVVETARGHTLGRVLTEGEALPDTGVPGLIDGHGVERVLRAPVDGVVEAVRDIGERVEHGDLVARVGSAEVRAGVAGIVRGLIRPGSSVSAGEKLGDVDPRGDLAACFTLSDKTRAISGGVLEAILRRHPAVEGPLPLPRPDLGLLDPTGRARYVHLVGAGGKTTLLYAWSRALAAEGARMVVSTTTRIRYPGPDQCPVVVVEPDPARLPGRVADAMPLAGRVAVVRAHAPGTGKLLGHEPAALDTLLDAGAADHVLVEADGSAGRPHKAHASHEPVVSARADLVVVLVGLGVLGRRAGDEAVHRSAIYRERLGRQPEDLVHPGDLAVSLLHPDGWLRTVPEGVPVTLLVTGVRAPQEWQDAHAVARAVFARDAMHRIRSVVAGDLLGPDARLVLLGTASL